MNTLLSCRELSKRGFPSAILIGPDVPPEGDYGELIEEWGIPVVRSRYLTRAISPFRDILAFFDIRRKIALGGYDIVHTHGSKPKIIARLSAKLPKSAVVVETVHGWPFYEQMSPLKLCFYVALERFGFRLSNRSILVTRRDLGKAIRHGIGKPDDYMVIRSGVEFSKYRENHGRVAEARALLGLESNSPPRVVGSVMRLCEQKAPDIFVSVARRVKDSFDGQVRFVIVGGGCMEEQTKQWVREAGLEDSVLLLGSRTDVPALLPAFDVFLLTSRFEGLPRALLESLAAGVPVVSTSVDGVTEVIIDGKQGGFICGFEDVEALAERTRQLLDDPELATSLLQGMDERLEPFTAERMIDDLEQLYTDLTRKGLKVVFLSDSEPFNIPNTVLTIINRMPRNEYTIVPLPGHGSFRKWPKMLRCYLRLYGPWMFPLRLAQFLARRLRGLFRTRIGRPCSLRQVAYVTGARYVPLSSVNCDRSREILESLQPDVFISLACPEILLRSTLAIPKRGAFNVHSSLLPGNRGMMPAFWSLFRDRGETGVTVHKMIRKLDAGGILLQRPIEATIRDTSLEELLRKTKDVGAQLVVEALQILEKDPDPPLAENPVERGNINSFPSRSDVVAFLREGGKISGMVGKPLIAMTFDVEEWFQAAAVRRWVPPEDRKGIPPRIEHSMNSILDLLDSHGATATFFFLGRTIERFPGLAERVLEMGHEIASQGYMLEELSQRSRADFARDLDRVSELMDTLGLPEPVGFRAPYFSLCRDTMWAIDEAIAHGYSYDSSIYPMFRHYYGVPEAPTEPFVLETVRGSLTEYPVACARFCGLRVPVGGGAHLRFYPSLLHRLLLRMMSRRKQQLPILHCRAWEIERIRPRKPVAPLNRLRQTYGTGSPTRRKLSRILSTYRAISIKELQEVISSSPTRFAGLPRVFASSLYTGDCSDVREYDSRTHHTKR